MSTTSYVHHMETLSSCPAAPPPPPPPAFSSSSKAQSRVLPQQQTPQPRSQLKHLPWQKIPSNRVVRSENLWTEVGQKFDGYRVNFDQIENLFAVTNNNSPAGRDGRDGVNSAGETGATDEIDGRKRQSEMQLLDCKRSMNVNIFLRQFHGKSHADIVRLLQTGDSHQLGVDKLRQLSKMLPEQEELARLKQFTANTDKLGQAERFFLQLIAIPHYELLIESLLTKEEFHQSIDTIRPALDAIIYSARDIKQSDALHELIYAVLITGNFLNTGFYGGDAAGIQLSSLLKLTEIQSNRPGMNLMHYVAQEVAENNPKLLCELRELKYLQEAASYPVEILRSDVKQLEQQVKSVYEQISKTELHFQQQMLPFLELARDDLQQLFIDLQEVEQLRVDLAVYFCEDVETFNIDYCLSTFNTFCQKFLSAAEENRLREEQLEKSRQRRVWRESNQGGADDTINSGNTNVYHTSNNNSTLPKNYRTSASVPEIRQPPDNNNSINNNNSSSDQFNPDELESCLLRPSRGGPEGGSFRRSRSRHSSSRLSTEFFDRERTSRSPQPQQQPAGDSGSTEIIDVDQTKSVDDLLNPAAVATGSAVGLLRRGSSVRSSCPSRVDSTKRRARHAETQQRKADDTEPAAVVSKSGSGTERKRERCDYDLSGSSINILSPCAKLLSLCADSPTETEPTDSTVETMAAKWRPEEPQTGSGRTASGLVSPTADSSSELHRLAAVRKERFKRLSELYSNNDDDDVMNSRRSVTGSGGSEWTQQSDKGQQHNIGSVSRTSAGDDSSSSGSGSVVDERLRSVSDMSCCEDEGFVSDCAASVVSQVNIDTARPTPSPSSSSSSAAAGPRTAPGSGQRQFHHKPAAASTNSRSVKPTTTTTTTTTATSRRTAGTPSTAAARPVGPPSKSAQAMSRGIISRLMAATESSTRRTGSNTVSDGHTSASSLQSTSTQSGRGKLIAAASGKTTSRTNTVRSRSQPPANRPSLSTPAAAAAVAVEDAEDERTTAVRQSRSQKSPHGAETTMTSGAASASGQSCTASDDQTEHSNKPRQQTLAVRQNVFTRLSADRSSAASRSSRQNASSSSSTAAAAASPFVRAAASRSSMPSSFSRNVGSKSVPAALRVAGDIAGRAPTTVKSPAARQRTTSTDRVVRDHTARRLDATDAVRSTERGTVCGPTMTVVDINLQDTDTESPRPSRPSRPTAVHPVSTTKSSPGKPSGMLTVEPHHMVSSRGDKSPVSVSPVDRRKITNDSTAKTSAAKSSSHSERGAVVSSSREEYFV